MRNEWKVVRSEMRKVKAGQISCQECCRINELRENKVEKENGYTISKSNEENDIQQMTD